MNNNEPINKLNGCFNCEKHTGHGFKFCDDGEEYFKDAKHISKRILPNGSIVFCPLWQEKIDSKGE